MELIFILTYDCNFRCTYCDIHKRKKEMSEEVLNGSLDFLNSLGLDISKVKFFGGEPLLKKDFIEKIIDNFPKKFNPTFYTTSNSTLVNNSFINYISKKDFKLTFSIDGDINTTGENRKLLNGNNLGELIIENTKKYSNIIRINQVITSKNSKDFFKNFLFIYNLGVREFNFLPEYYGEWSKSGLNNLKKGFDEIFEFYKKGNDFKLVNLENFSETSFFNLGIVIDTDGNIYGTNLILSGIFEKYKNQLKIGNIYEGLFVDINLEEFRINYLNKIQDILNNEYSSLILKSVKYVDLILNNFCNNFNKK